MKKIILLLVLTIGFVSCFPDEKIYLRSYVMEYYDVGGIVLQDIEGVVDTDTQFRVSTTYGSHIGSWDSKGEQKTAYDALCRKHGDMTFNRNLKVNFGSGGGLYRYPGVDFTAIDITSSADYDDEHPAGTSLGDIVMAEFGSAKPYIDSGYKKYDKAVGRMGELKVCLINKRFNEFTPDDLTLLGYDNSYLGWFNFVSGPTLGKEHTFTVTLTADDGRVFSDSMQVTFQ